MPLVCEVGTRATSMIAEADDNRQVQRVAQTELVYQIRKQMFGKSLRIKQPASCSATPSRTRSEAPGRTSRPAIQCDDHILCYATSLPADMTCVSVRGNDKRKTKYGKGNAGAGTAQETRVLSLCRRHGTASFLPIWSVIPPNLVQ